MLPIPVSICRAATTYEGGSETLNWLIFDGEGKLTKKIVSVDKGELNLFHREYKPSNFDADGNIIWTLSEEEVREYGFDKAGNIAKEIIRKRNSADQPFRVIQAIERAFITL